MDGVRNLTDDPKKGFKETMPDMSYFMEDGIITVQRAGSSASCYRWKEGK